MSLRRTRLKSDLPKRANFRAVRRDSASAAVAGEGAAAQATALSPEAARRAVSERTTTSKRRIQRRATPFELLQQPLLMASRKVFDLRRFLIVIAATGIALLLPAPPGMSEEASRAVALFVFTGMILALEPAPLPISALLVPVAQVALGIDTVQAAFAPFGQPAVFLILTSLFLAEALRKHGLTRRLAMRAIVISGGAFSPLILSLLVMTGLLSMWVQNTATTAVLIPVAITIAQRFPNADDARRALPMLILAVAYGASIGGMATIIGSGQNAIAAGVLNQISQFGFIEWMVYALPVALILMPLAWWLMMRMNQTPAARVDISAVQADVDREGELSGQEREVLIVMGVAVVLWVLGAQVERWLGLPTTLLSSVIVTIGAVAYLSFEEIIDWNDMKGVNWGVFLVVGAGFTLGDAMEKTGLNDWIAMQAQPLLGGLPYAVTLLAVLGVLFVITQFINDITLGAIFSPILVALAQATEIAPARLVIPAVLVITLSFALPSSSSRMVLVAVTGAVPKSIMRKTGFVVGLVSFVVVYLFFLGLGYLGWI
jgi:sodium-dependent dicarboxylate transporter 2/3/5